VSRARLRIVTRLGSSRSPYSNFLFGSLLVHVVVAVALIVVPSLRKRPQLYDNPMIIELAAPAPARARPAAPAAPAVAEPQPAEPAEGVRAQPEEPKIVEKPKEKPVKKPEPAPVNTPPRDRPDTPGTDAAGTGAVGDAGASVAPMEGGDLAFAWYRASVTAALYGRWQRPLLTGITEPLEVRVAFEIQRDGSVRGIFIEQSSGVPSLDRSAQRAVADASPLPPLPATWREPVLPASFVFSLFPGEY